MLEELTQFLMAIGPLGLFIAAIIANASVLIPIPIDLILLTAMVPHNFFGLGIFSPLMLAIITALGAAIGEMSGYFIGYAGRATYDKMKKKEISQLDSLKQQLEKRGLPFLILFATVPLPFDVIALAAGLIKYSKTKFFIGCFIGKTIRFIIVAYVAYYGITWLMQLFSLG